MPHPRRLRPPLPVTHVGRPPPSLRRPDPHRPVRPLDVHRSLVVDLHAGGPRGSSDGGRRTASAGSPARAHPPSRTAARGAGAARTAPRSPAPRTADDPDPIQSPAPATGSSAPSPRPRRRSWRRTPPATRSSRTSRPHTPRCDRLARPAGAAPPAPAPAAPRRLPLTHAGSGRPAGSTGRTPSPTPLDNPSPRPAEPLRTGSWRRVAHIDHRRYDDYTHPIPIWVGRPVPHVSLPEERGTLPAATPRS